MGIGDTLRSRVITWLFPLGGADQAWMKQLEDLATQRDYYNGAQRRQMKKKIGQADDNLVINFIQLIVERSISMQFGTGVEFELDVDQESPPAEYLRGVWEANKKDILLHKVGQFGAINGTCAIKIVPDGVQHRDTGAILPRLIAIDPLYLRIVPRPDDVDTVEQYEIMYVIDTGRGSEGRKEVTRREGNVWAVDYLISAGNSGKWTLDRTEPWLYPFSPIVHWQNLPNAGNVYGRSDIEDVMELQDRMNFIGGNISKIIRYHAHPKTWASGFAGNTGSVSWGADEMITVPSSDGRIENLEMQSDLASSMEYMTQLRQMLFDVSRTVDISSMSDKLGALTNFGLRVLYQDAVAKVNSKREICGDALSDLNGRLLQLGGYNGVNGGVVIWQDPLPVNDQEQIAEDEFTIGNKLVSRETVATRRGFNWEREQERIQAEQAQGDNIGAALLRAFNGGA